MAFTPRLTAPTDLTTYYGSWNSYNRFSSYGNEGNCTWYAYGRTGEIAGRNIYNEFYITQSPGNGKDWIYNTWPSYTHTSGSIDLHLGDILVWGGGTYGHVEVVEAISNNTITTSYSISGENWAKSRFFATRQISKPTWGSYLGYVEYNDGSTAYLTNTFIGYIHNKYAEDGPTPPTPTEEPSVTVYPSAYDSIMQATEDYIDFNFTVVVEGIPIDEDARGAISFSSNCHRSMYTSNWTYTEYVIDGVRYLTGRRSLIVKYNRLHDYAYYDTAYMYYRKTFSNGSVNSATRMGIQIDAKETDDDIISIIAYLLGRRKKRVKYKIK